MSKKPANPKKRKPKKDAAQTALSVVEKATGGKFSSRAGGKCN